MPTRQQKLSNAVKVLGKYYGIHSIRELAERISLDSVNDSESSVDIEISRPTETEATLIEYLIDTSDGAFLTTTFMENFNTQIEQSEVLENDFAKLLQVHYEGDATFYRPEAVIGNAELSEEERREVTTAGVRQMLGYSAPGGDSNVRLNSSPNQPTKDAPGLSIYLSNSKRVTLESQNTAAATIFLNGIPNVELQRAMPYVNVEFFFPRGPKSDISGRLQNLSLNKFLLGGVIPQEGSVLDIMAEGDTVQGTSISSRNATEENPIPDRYSRAGMELFTAPQTLINADDNTSFSARANPIIDKFRPLMTLSDLSITIEPSRGLRSFKRGSLSLLLHDRSRLPEVAEFIRADLYGTNEITIEYGWTHPDGQISVSENAYGDLIDGMRVKEKFMVVNSSFNFEADGQVSIKLNIAMRGSSEFDTELMSSDNETFSNTVREIGELQRQIAELRARAFPASTATTSVEIRGRQILDAAQDATNNPVLGSDLREALAQFRTAYRTSENPSARRLYEVIQELYGDQVTQHRGGGSSGPSGQPTLIATLRRSIQESIGRKVTQLEDSPDPFLLPGYGNGGQRYLSSRSLPQSERSSQRRFNDSRRGALTANISNTFPCSLGKLLLLFVGEPLANTGNYDEVQMFFYPFNEYAGQASKLNIANFIVDIEYFADELARYRLEHISRSSVMSLEQFMNFVADTLVDDPAANSYGLTLDGEALHRLSFPDEEGRVRSTVAASDDAAVFRVRMERALQGVTPDGTFRMPQVGIYVEALPEKVGQNDGEDSEEANGRTILRLHVFDQAATTYESLGRLIQATRRDQIGTIGSFPNLEGGNQAVVDNNQEIASTIIESATSMGLIEWLPYESETRNEQANSRQTPNNSERTYRVVGGSQKLKEFIMANSPYIIYGAAGTTVKAASLASMQNSQLATVNLLRSMRREEAITPNGENSGGLPMQIIPTQLSMDCVGNPLLNFMQTYFIDFQTGTTADNLYAITGVEHKFTQGDFSTSVTFVPSDAWGTYRSLISTVGTALDHLGDAVARENEGNANSSGEASGGSGNTG